MLTKKPFLKVFSVILTLFLTYITTLYDCYKGSNCGIVVLVYEGDLFVVKYLALSFVILCPLTNSAYGEAVVVHNDHLQREVIKVDDFEQTGIGNTLGDWVEIIYPKVERHSKYSILTEDNGNKCLSASSENSASGLYKAVSVDLKEYPYLVWRWKVTKLVRGSNVNSKDTDDYAARVYITFKYDGDTMSFSDRLKYRLARVIYGNVPSRAVTYYWAENETVGDKNLNAYTDKVAMIAAQSGDEKLDKWVVEKVNVFKDFKAIFNIEPSLVESVAIMTDTDNTGNSAGACYDDIYFSK